LTICAQRIVNRQSKIGNSQLIGMSNETYSVDIAGVHRELRLMQVGPGVRIAVLNILGDTELTQAAAKALVQQLPAQVEFLVTAEAKSIPLAYAMSVESGLPYIVLRKSYKPYMGDALSAETLSITTNKPQTLYLDEKDRAAIHGKRVVVVDDVISTGSTLQGMRLIMQKAGAEVVAEAAIFTEGDRAKWSSVLSLGHLPVFIAEK
jgi:adenine phosphoribosyltransferase